MNADIKATAAPEQSWFRRHPVWTGTLAVLGVLLLLIITLFLLSFNVDDTTVSDPAGSHEEALARIETIQESEKASGEINPVCVSNVLSHGEQTEKVIVFSMVLPAAQSSFGS